MELTFFGATGGTTGSCHRIRAGGHTVLLECGLFQGRRDESRRRNERFGFDPTEIDAVIQSHAHVDHSGKLPMLVRHGFAGRIWATPATRDLCELMLHDTAKILQQDAEHLNRQRMRRKRLAEHRAALERAEARGRGRGRERNGTRDRGEGRAGLASEAEGDAALPGWHPNATQLLPDDVRLPEREVEPLFLAEDVEDTLAQFEGRHYGDWFEPVPNMRVRFHDAGHILGSAWIEAEIREGTGVTRLVFTGDYGRKRQPILRDPEPLSEADVVVTESTYGNRQHPPVERLDEELAAAVRRLAERGRGRLLVPAFAVGRTQNVLYSLAKLFREKKAPPVRVVLDSPLATAATHVHARHHECFDAEARLEYDHLMSDPLLRQWLVFTRSVDESKALNDDPRPTLIVSASGMLESGRILHHLARNVGSTDAEILIVGFQAEHTLGRKLLDGAREVFVLGIRHEVRARVTALLGFSAHADKDELMEALEPGAKAARAVFLVHGEDDQRRPLAERLRERGFRRVELPSDERAWELAL
jgi:metallo-beta-lactamase family protein